MGYDRLELSANGLREREPKSEVRETKEDREHSPEPRPPSPPVVEPEWHSRGTAEPSVDAVEAALAEALRGATAAGEWAVVAQLAGELAARREKARR